MKKEGKDLEGGRCFIGKDEQLGFTEEDRAKFEEIYGKDYELRERMGPHGGN